MNQKALPLKRGVEWQHYLLLLLMLSPFMLHQCRHDISRFFSDQETQLEESYVSMEDEVLEGIKRANAVLDAIWSDEGCHHPDADSLMAEYAKFIRENGVLERELENPTLADPEVTLLFLGSQKLYYYLGNHNQICQFWEYCPELAYKHFPGFNWNYCFARHTPPDNTPQPNDN